MYCVNCGNKLEEEARFCQICGCPAVLQAGEHTEPEPEQVVVPQTEEVKKNNPGEY